MLSPSLCNLVMEPVERLNFLPRGPNRVVAGVQLHKNLICLALRQGVGAYVAACANM